MDTDWTPVSLAAFERDIADTFNRGEIKAPVHLAGGNEGRLIEIFKHVQPRDWVCCTWRSHYHCLLKGVPAEEVKAAVIDGRSIALCFPMQRVISSALVGGIVPVALGLAWAAGNRYDFNAGQEAVWAANAGNVGPETVWAFIGDMTAHAGIVHECAVYAQSFGLQLRIVVENNRKSVATDTAKSWGMANRKIDYSYGDIVSAYDYDLTWPHVGSGKWVHM